MNIENWKDKSLYSIGKGLLPDKNKELKKNMLGYKFVIVLLLGIKVNVLFIY